ncbi:PEP-CTERM sorting domain-containing protein [Planctomycetales bacterium ZRK34]|nr:PEP-CTERM sorting domain-containing protein [Planctomycetales bacterium ZRK34]
MRKFLSPFGAVAAILLTLAAGSPALADTALNLLFFGNSFTIQDDVPGKVGLLAAADGHAAPLIVADLLGGQDLDYHIGEVAANPTNNVNHASIAGDTWDFVVMQGYSTEATHLGDPADFRADAQTLYTDVRDHASGRGAGVTGVLYETWARPNLVPGSFPTLSAMQAEITTNYHLASNEINIAQGAGSSRVAPVGEAFENLLFDGSLYDADDYHASTKGSLLASMMIYRTIYGEQVSDILYADAQAWAGVNETTWNQLVVIADATTVVPEPTTFALLGLGMLVLPRRRR